MASPSGWALLHSPLPRGALKPLNSSVYGVSGLTDVNEGFLIERLWQSGLTWEWVLDDASYCGSEERTPQGKTYTTTWYLAQVRGTLVIEGRRFSGSGGHDNRKLDAAFKGAATVAFKNACKAAGLTTELYKGGQMRDVVYEGDADGGATGSAAEPNGQTAAPPDTRRYMPPESEHHQPDVLSPEQRAELDALATTLPKKKKNPAWVSDQLGQYSYRSVRGLLLQQHRSQCGAACSHSVDGTRYEWSSDPEGERGEQGPGSSQAPADTISPDQGVLV